jgi:hypothetical protein
MMRLAPVLCVITVLLAVTPGLPAGRWAEVGDLSARLPALDPTPAGEGHLGLLASGDPLQLRLPVPAQLAEAYFADLGSLVAYSGKGTSYQLIVRRDGPDGTIVFQGPVIANGDAWNTANREPVDLTGVLTDADRQSGFLDLYVTALVADDGWTLYRSNAARPVQALVVIPSPEMRARAASMRALTDRHISVLPVPREIRVAAGDLPLSAATRIVYEPSAPASVAQAAGELQAVICERTGLQPTIAQVAQPAPGDLALAVIGSTAWPVPAAATGLGGGAEGYLLSVTAAGAQVLGTGEPGCFYGAMSLGQMAAIRGGAPGLPLVQIRDWPAFPMRIIQYDIARGQTVNVPYVERMVREMARCKVNALLFYMEDDFRFRKYPSLGREGTFTHEKARELSDYARQFHVQLIPQFESLGHAAAVLAHDELKDLREAGGSWVFCTCEPRTWEFLDDVFGELTEAFPESDYIHVGGDEFEDGFGKCDKCRAVIAAGGMGALYADHMNKLNALAKKHGKTMLFWPSHWGPTPELTQMSLRYKDLLDKDCIPTEWIYHGPSTYPEIEAYQAAGYRDIYCSPAVESYSRVWPDHTTTFRAIRGFYQAGAARGSGGAYCTTWEFMHGALVENSWYGLLFAAECSWSPDSTRRSDFDRRFADIWWGLTSDGITARMADTIFCPFADSGPAATWRNGWLVREMLWATPEAVMREYGLKNPDIARLAPSLVAAMDDGLQRLQAFSGASRNQLTFDAAGLAFRLMRYAGAKVAGFSRGTELYRQARAAAATDPTACADLLTQVRNLLAELHTQAVELGLGYARFVENCGAYRGDQDRLEQQAADLERLTATVDGLIAGVRGGTLNDLPSGTDLGFLTGSYTRLGGWSRDTVTEAGVTLTFDATPAITAPGEYQVEFQYERGAHGLSPHGVQLLADGKPVASDTHAGWTGAGSRGNVYTLKLPAYDPAARYEVTCEVASAGGTDSLGTIWLVRP